MFSKLFPNESSSSSLNSTLYFVLKCALAFILLNCLYFLSVSLVQLLDKDTIRNTILQSIDNGTNSIKCASSISPYGFISDTWTESVAQTISLEKTEESIFRSALLARSAPICNSEDIIREFLEKGDPEGLRPYYRYWHGYQLYMKPLLRFTSVARARLLFHIVIFALIFLLYRSIKDSLALKRVFLCLFLPIPLLVNVLDISILYSAIFAIILASLVLFIYFIRYKEPDLKGLAAFFFFSGSILNFFGFLIVPQLNAALLGYILMLSLYLKDGTQLSRLSLLKALSLCVLLWFGGYFLTYVAKWVFASFVLPTDIISENLNYVKWRLMGKVHGENPLSVKYPLFSVSHAYFEILRVDKFSRRIFRLLWVTSLIFFIYLCKRSYNTKSMKSMLADILVLSTPALVIIFWLELVRNQSLYHVVFNRFSLAYFIIIIPASAMLFWHTYKHERKQEN